MLQARDQGENVSSSRSRTIKIISISLSVAMASLDAAIANTILPTLSTELSIAPPEAVWIVTSYQLVMVAAMLPLSALGGAVGHQRIFAGGLALFTLTSLICGLATSMPVLVLARAAQGLGAAGIMGSNAALVREIYPPAQLGRGLGVNALVIALGLAGGPVVASAVLSVATWHWLFLLNVPIGALAIALIGRSKSGEPPGHGPGMVSSLLCVMMFGFFIHGLGQLSARGFSLLGLSELVAASICCVILVRHDRRSSYPVLPVDLFLRPQFCFPVSTALFAYATQGLAMVALPFVYHLALGRSQLEVGFLIAPWPIMGALMAPIAGSLSDRLPSQVLGAIGLGCLGIGLGTVSLLSAHASTELIMLCMGLCGFGFGLFLSPNQRAIMANAPTELAGPASGILGTVRLLGQALGATAVSFALATSMQHGLSIVLLTGAFWASIGLVLSVLGYRYHRQVRKK